MSGKKEIFYIIIILTSGFLSFVNARMRTLSQKIQVEGTSEQWLVNEPLKITESETKFNDEVSRLTSNLGKLQSELLGVLDNPLSSNDDILEHVDSVNQVHEYLIRQIGEHIVELRHELGQANREKLMQFCAEAVSGPMRRLGARMNGQNQGQGGRGYRYGQQNRGQRGYGYRRGAQQAGSGYGQRMRFWDRLANRLSLTSEQVTEIQKADPNFESEALSLNDDLVSKREKLLSIFQNPQSSDSDLLEQIDSLISTHSKIERILAEHVIVLRPYLTNEQQKWLIGLGR